MTTFKRFINEASTFDISKYIPPQPRSKFQLGDIVVVFGDQRWSMYQPIRSNQFVGKMGTIEAYKPASMSSPKYAVKFQDGQVEGITAAYLLGPFKSAAAAEKYKNIWSNLYQAQPKVNIEDLKGYSGNTVVQRNEKFENKAREIFTNSPFNFKWFEEPLVYTSRTGNKSATILGYIPKSSTPYKDLKSIDLKNSYLKNEVNNKTFFNFLNDNFCIFRINNDLKGTLKSWNANGAYGEEYGVSPYAVNLPRVALEYLNPSYSNKSAVLPWDKEFFSSLDKDICRLSPSNLPLSVVRKPDNLINAYNFTLGFYNKKVDPQVAFNLMFKIEKVGNDLVVNKNVSILQKDQDRFLNLKFKPGISYEVECSDGNNIKIPPDVTSVHLKTNDKSGGLKKLIKIKDLSIFKNTNVTTIDITNFDIQNLSGLPDPFNRLALDNCIIKNLNGLPTNVDSLELTGLGVESLDGGENITCRFINIKNTKFTNLDQIKNIPESQFYKLNDALNDIPNIYKQIEKMIKNRVFINKMKPKTRETFGDIFSEL
jgi:hypothetical protein